LAFKVKVFMFSKTVKTKFRKEFVGGSDPGSQLAASGVRTAAGGTRALPASPTPPTFADLMAPTATGRQPWDVYCAAFAA
jgi:hypothetical protein